MPCQLVFGINPRLPNKLEDGLPQSGGQTHSEILAQHTNALYTAKQVFNAGGTAGKGIGFTGNRQVKTEGEDEEMYRTRTERVTRMRQQVGRELETERRLGNKSLTRSDNPESNRESGRKDVEMGDEEEENQP